MVNKMIAVAENKEPVEGNLYYATEDLSFCFKPKKLYSFSTSFGEGGVASLQIGTLQVEIESETGRCLFVWGYHPYFQWENLSLMVPEYSNGAVYYISKGRIANGVSINLPDSKEWVSYFDRKSNLLCVTNKKYPIRKNYKIATGVILGVEDCELCSIWLNPVFK
ncbi:hypothetical protein [Actinopolyspora mortivallis]|uniref:hypothetical protein n=1 Tax=Actinopolyspora mortivallis TaxID=33906 RepID=UPI0011B277D5|nr:hypothetical protein [Actinopolyspora mortivallis]